MKYLKHFNEGVSINDIQDLADNYLSFLKDKGFNIDASQNIKGYYDIDVFIDAVENDLIWWEPIKDDILPFIQLIESGSLGVKLLKVMMYVTNIGTAGFSSYDELVNDTTVENMGCLSILIEPITN